MELTQNLTHGFNVFIVPDWKRIGSNVKRRNGLKTVVFFNVVPLEKLFVCELLCGEDGPGS